MGAEAAAPQFVVVGAGSLGCVYGANLARIGQKVAFIDVHHKQETTHKERKKQNKGLTGDFVVRCFATTDAAKAPHADVVLLCAPSHATAQPTRAAEIILKSA